MRRVASQAKVAGASALIAVVLFFSGLVTFLTPLPVLYAYVTRGRAAGALSAILSAAGVAAVYLFLYPRAAGSEGALAYIMIPGQGLEPVFSTRLIILGGIAYFAFFLSVAISLAEGALRKLELLKWGGVALLSSLAVVAIAAALFARLGGGGMVEGFHAYLADMFREMARVNEEAGQTGAQVAFLADRADDVSSFFIRLIPGLAFVFATLAVVVNLIVCRRIVRGGHAFAHVHNVARFRLPDALIWFVIASGAAYFLDAYALHAGWPGDVALNTLLSLGVLYFLQGMAVIVYFVQGIRAPLLRTLAYVAMILFLQTVSLGLLVVGVADVWANFRLRRWRVLHHHS